MRLWVENCLISVAFRWLDHILELPGVDAGLFVCHVVPLQVVVLEDL